ncbi:TRAP transporter small permease subunit [Falsihalocynthiibacter sp. S25ZX9]|uniref:TRAP transporter small permease subunit n=1 Tax=Falsihalocynthiibacter sp. S25ZX9 TaxID=3240870 RepID=UPI0035106921
MLPADAVDPGGEGGSPLPLRLLDGATQGMNVAGTVLILCLMLLIGADVTGRNLFNSPINGVPELVTLSIVAIVFLQAPQALRSGRFPRSDALQPIFERLAPRCAKLLLDIFDLAGAIVTGVIVFATWPILKKAFERGEFIGALGDFTAPVWPVKLIVLTGSLVLALQFIASIVRRHSGELIT